VGAPLSIVPYPVLKAAGEAEAEAAALTITLVFTLGNFCPVIL
jgi:hypothetical protein